jgi:hypothetical protein
VINIINRKKEEKNNMLKRTSPTNKSHADYLFRLGSRD